MRRALRVLVWIVGVLAVLFIGFAAYVRFAPDDARVWHVDPASASGAGAANAFVVSPTGAGADMASPVFDMAPAALLSAFRQAALAAPRTSILGESDGIITFVQRSALISYPDYISVRAVEVEGGAALHIWSRSRYGADDWGVNRARVLAWLEKL